jgi:hypothetical protein
VAKLYDLKSLWLCVGVSTIFAGWGIIRITANEPGGLISWRQRRGAAFFASPGRWTRHIPLFSVLALVLLVKV